MMPGLQGGPSPHRWNQIRRLPLDPAIRTLEQYEQAVMIGTLDVLEYLRSVDPVRALAVADIQQVHYQMFRAVHPWAGQFRGLGQMATIAGFPTADPQRIVRELELALFQSAEMLTGALSARDPHGTIAALGFFHVRFERVHPFLDGNGRSGRAILAVQFEKLFGTLPRFTDQVGYRAAMRAGNRQDLALFINYLGASVGLPAVQAPWRLPFHVSPRFLETAEDEPTFEEDLIWSRAAS